MNLTIESFVGNTPLVKLQRIPVHDGVHPSTVILSKLEGNNPAGSVKDRPAMAMISRAEARGDIKPGDTLIEATSGNTGIALSMAAAIKVGRHDCKLQGTDIIDRRFGCRGVRKQAISRDCPIGVASVA